MLDRRAVDVKVRTIEQSELRDALRVTSGAFGHGTAVTDELYADEQAVFEPGRFHVAEIDGATVGTACEYSFELTVPGGARLPMAGVSCVSVVATHRRRGALRALMAYELDAVVANGEPLAGLTASEATIYRRFGYGVATWWQAFKVETRRSAFLHEPRCGGAMRMITEAEGLELLPQVWAQHCDVYAGAIAREAKWWELYTRDREDWREGASPRYLAVHESDGTVDGYIEYRIKRDWDRGNTVVVEELVAVDPEVELAMWRYAFDVDLASTTSAFGVRVDLPLSHRLADPRSLQVTAVRDHLWLRLLDIPRCLTARTYAADGSVVLDVVDGFRPDVAGRYRLEVSGGVAQCERVRGGDTDADIVLDVAELGGVYLGGVSFTSLREAGVIDEARAGGVAAADALFATERPPWCLMGF